MTLTFVPTGMFSTQGKTPIVVEIPSPEGEADAAGVWRITFPRAVWVVPKK